MRRKLISNYMSKAEVYSRLMEYGIKPSVQRLAILEYLMTHHTHPTIEDVYLGLCEELPTLSKTTVYNTLRMFSEHGVATMITIDEHRVCYDGIVEPHAHFFCKRCEKVYDLHDQPHPTLPQKQMELNGHQVDEVQLYYKGVCKECRKTGVN